MPSEMNTITAFLTIKFSLSNLGETETAAIIALAGLGAFYAGRLTCRAIFFLNGLRAS